MIFESPQRSHGLVYSYTGTCTELVDWILSNLETAIRAYSTSLEQRRLLDALQEQGRPVLEKRFREIFNSDGSVTAAIRFKKERPLSVDDVIVLRGRSNPKKERDILYPNLDPFDSAIRI